MPHPSTHVANAVLREVFDSGRVITPTRLQCVLFLISERYFEETGELLIDAQFSAHPYGPRISHLDFQFAPAFKPHSIRRFAKDAESRAYVTDDKVLRRLVRVILAETDDESTDSLIASLRAPGGRWYAAWQADKRYMSDPSMSAPVAS